MLQLLLDNTYDTEGAIDEVAKIFSEIENIGLDRENYLNYFNKDICSKLQSDTLSHILSIKSKRLYDSLLGLVPLLLVLIFSRP